MMGDSAVLGNLAAKESAQMTSGESNNMPQANTQTAVGSAGV